MFDSLRPPTRSGDDSEHLLRACCPLLCSAAQWSVQRARLLPLFSKRVLPVGTDLIHAGDRAPLVVLLTGRAESSSNKSIYGPGDVLGYDSWLFDVPAPATVTTTAASTTVLLLPRSRWRHVHALATPASHLRQVRVLAAAIGADDTWAGVRPSALWLHRTTAPARDRPPCVVVVLHGAALVGSKTLEPGVITVVSAAPHFTTGSVWIELGTADVDKLLGAGAAQQYLAARGPEVSLADPGQTSVLAPPTLEDFELLDVLGYGSFGQVSLARDLRSNGLCALKIVPKSAIPNVKFAHQAVRERQVLATVQHPFVARYVASFQDDWNLYLAAEFVQGGELWHRLYDCPTTAMGLDEADVVFYAANIVLALQALHARRVVYRDLKLENLLLDTRGYLKLIDMGFALPLAPDDTRAHTVCGTPEYMAPELVAGTAYDHTVDYWALGTLLYELLMGASLFGRPDDTPARTFARITAVRSTGLPLHPDFASRASPALQSFVLALLAAEPARRLGSAADAVLAHAVFVDVDWTALLERRLDPPYVPPVTNPTDTRHFCADVSCDDDDWPSDGRRRSAVLSVLQDF
ncbi:cAMP-dependent protein kinase catalytic subunit [Achlya hypogyna]|uniref:cAMP-dependent protein kinase catalytic subunit n=1 Tax=Achlya hypogyna TaxID=1202772 RepID=A0A1V9YGA0_ACHHY|nr:cAMP-dependent protein kinase catalytic subunit [Achlya hypogyna]